MMKKSPILSFLILLASGKISYLNDMPDGDGQTEFLYQKRRLTPTAGTVVMWPAGYTHVHKGNTVFSQDKYILTGWYIKNS